MGIASHQSAGGEAPCRGATEESGAGQGGELTSAISEALLKQIILIFT